MAAPKLNNRQQAEIIKRLAARERYKTIAADFGLSEDGVSYYARRHGEEIERLRKERDERIIQEGLAVAQNRVVVLNDILEDLLEEWSINGRLTEEVKISSTGKEVRYSVVNEPLFRQIDRYMDAIAKETGGREKNSNVRLRLEDMSIEELVRLVLGEIGDAQS